MEEVKEQAANQLKTLSFLYFAFDLSSCFSWK